MFKTLNVVNPEKAAKKLIAERTKAKLTLDQLAEKSGLTKQTLFRIEHAMVEPRICSLQKIADALNIKIEKLM